MPANWLIPLPDEVSDDQAAGLLLQGLTAHALVHRCARLQAGETIVVQAAAGGTGTLAVQLAKRAGGRVIGLASSEEKRELATRLGADATVDSRADDLRAAILEANEGREVDAVLEMSGGETFEACLRTLAPFGRMVLFGIASREPNEVNTGHLLRHSRAVIGFWLMHLIPRRDEVAAMIADLLGAVASGELEVVIGDVYPLVRGAPGSRGPRRPPHLGQAAAGPLCMTSFSDLGLEARDPARARRARLHRADAGPGAGDPGAARRPRRDRPGADRDREDRRLRAAAARSTSTRSPRRRRRSC